LEIDVTVTDLLTDNITVAAFHGDSDCHRHLLHNSSLYTHKCCQLQSKHLV